MARFVLGAARNVRRKYFGTMNIQLTEKVTEALLFRVSAGYLGFFFFVLNRGPNISKYYKTIFKEVCASREFHLFVL